jgi:2-keto-4-pentenoate hydratase
MQLEIADIARRMKAAQDEVRQIPQWTTQAGHFDLETAYEVAHLIHQARLADGAIAVGRKIGFTNPDMWARYGVRAPIWAHLYDSTVRRVAGAHAECALGRYTEPKIEPEIVFHFQRAPMSGEEGELLASIDWVAHGFEIVQSHFPGWQFEAADTVADWSLHGTLLIGDPQPIDRLGPDLQQTLKNFTLQLWRDGTLVETGRGSNVLGSPLQALGHLVRVLAAQPQYAPLAAGEIVTTGTVTAAQTVAPGQCWHTKLAGIALPGLTLDCVA